MKNISVQYSKKTRYIQDFASRGLLLLDPDTLGCEADLHERIYKKEFKAWKENQPISPHTIPEIQDLLNAPGLIEAVNQLIGEKWAIVPFTHNAAFVSGGRDQHWHKDDNGPYNSRKQRHHHSVQLEMLYYPQPVTPVMGPTATIPYAHYWTFNHEENHDNFAGADHLDFHYVHGGMERQAVSGPNSSYSQEDIENATTAHDIRMREAVTNTGWPLVKSFEAAPLKQGTVLLYSHNTWHRGNHRRDHWDNWPDNPRFMWRFFMYRTSDPAPSEKTYVEVNWQEAKKDPLTGIDLSGITDDLTTVWRYHDCWMRSGKPAPASPGTADLTDSDRKKAAEALYGQLLLKGEEAEPQRIGAAYKLASLGDAELATQWLSKAIQVERESVRRAATYGLAAMGEASTETWMKLINSPVKWLRKAAVFGLGEAADLTTEVLDALRERLQHDQSVYVRSVAAGSIGCLGRRAIAHNEGTALLPQCVQALLDSLAKEENRESVESRQHRSIKYTRPDDESDVCEGNGITFGLERFENVRSAVRENALWSLVMLASHGTDIFGDSLPEMIQRCKTILKEDKNVISAGYALDVLNRLGNIDADSSNPHIKELQAQLPELLNSIPLHCNETLIRVNGV